MPTLNQPNLITRHEIHTRTELWNDKIYYISNNPYWNKDYQFLPLPQRFATILQEFREAVNKQKASETSEEKREQAQARINEIYQEIKEIIQQKIDLEESSGIDFEGTPTKEEKKELIEYEKNKQERIKQLKLGLTKKTVNQLQRFNTEHLENNFEVEQLLQEWQEQRKILLDRKNICFILQDTQDTFQFCYQPPKGNFPALQDFLWYRNNIWYETTNWQRINHENAIITAQRSFFIHNYIKFFNQGGNGVLHHSPKFGNKDEICQCPAFLESTEFVDFISDWQPTYKLFKIKNFMGGTFRTELWNKPYGVERKYPVFHTLDLEEASDMESKELYPTTYFLLPDWYKKGTMSGMETYEIKFKNSKSTLEDWIKNAKMERMGHDGQGGEYEHLLKHVNVNYFWNDKKIHESTLDEMDWNHFKIVVRANPAGIMYRFKSNKVLFRYSEDLNFSLEADKMAGLALKMGTKILDGLIKTATAGLLDPKASEVADEAGKTTENYLHGKDDNDKSKDERQSERKKTLASAGLNAVSSVMGSIPSLLDASHTHGDYSLAEIALRFNTIQFKIRLEFNKNIGHRYQMMKGLKKNGNLPFNTKKIGNIFRKGYFKIVPNIFQGDKNGFFASIFSKGVYLYEEHPNEYFLEELETGKFERGIVNDDPVMTNTTIQVNHTSAIGRDNLVHVDDMSWVWKDSFLQPVGGGTDLFPQMINDGRRHIKKDDANAWKFDGYAQWSSKPLTIPPNVKYEWYMHAFSSGEKSAKNFRGVDDNITVQITQDGADWSLDIMGKVEITETIGNPDAIGGGVEINDFEEVLPEMEDEQQTEGLENLEQDLQPEEEQQQQQEVQDELEPEPEAQKEEEKQEELEQEDERTKEKTKEKQKQKQKQKEEEEQQEPENSREGEK